MPPGNQSLNYFYSIVLGIAQQDFVLHTSENFKFYINFKFLYFTQLRPSSFINVDPGSNMVNELNCGESETSRLGLLGNQSEFSWETERNRIPSAQCDARK